jgi:hypothetical protein
LTSADTLSALRELPKTNPKLHDEITADRTNDGGGDDEPAFSADSETDAGDGSDIPIDVMRSVVMSGGSVATEGFGVDEEGSIVRTGAAEMSEEQGGEGDENVEQPVKLGRGHRAKAGSTRYGAEWEQH